MKICFVGKAGNYHMNKWCTWFARHGHEVHLISFVPGKIEGAGVHLIDVGFDPEKQNDIAKLQYLTTGRKIRKIIDEIEPDIVNAHYASSYGAALALSGVKGYVLSVWGSDVYDFPRKSPLHRALLKLSLDSAGHLFSTSRAMAIEASKYTDRKFEITPFGVDMELFNPMKRTRTSDEYFVIGTVKTLSDKYGIRNILEAAAEIKAHTDIPLRLRIAGRGEKEQEYRALAEKLGIDDITVWLGFISQEEAAGEWADMDVALVPSESESFGVSAVEAEASGTALVISDTEGLKETTLPGETSIVVPKGDSRALSEAIARLYADSGLRHQMGEKGRKYALENFELDECFGKIEKIFESYL